MSVSSVSAALFDWYVQFGRTHLPWRQTREPYDVVVAEFMLQQTQVDRVLPLYIDFIRRFPSFAALAASDASEVVRAWRGLGYNSRAVRLRKLAQIVVAEHAGQLPNQRESLLSLAGVGPYTAAAIRAFAFDHDDVALDTNVRRVVHRLMLGLEFPRRAGDREIDAIAAAMVPPGRGHDWNSAIMDLGATICTARAPKCLLCPLVAHCAAAPIDGARLASLAKAGGRDARQDSLPFVRTTRFLRGRIIDRLRDVPLAEMLRFDELQRDLARVIPLDRLVEIRPLIDVLVAEGIITADAAGVRLKS